MTSRNSCDEREIDRLIDRMCDQIATADDLAELGRLVVEYPAVQDRYLAALEIHAGLAWRMSPGRQFSPEELVRYGSGASSFGTRDSCIEEIASPNFSIKLSPLPTLSTNFVGGPVFSYMVATVVLCAMLLSAWAYKISHVDQLAGENGRPPVRSYAQPQFDVVGRVTGMKDCVWAKDASITMPGASVPLGREYALESGLLEIEYAHGARVVLEGPCRYTADSRASGFLRVGKLVARAEKNDELRMMNDESKRLASDIHHSSFINHPLFSVRTPTAVVTDLGTEFGVEVDENGSCEIHLIEGVVLAKPVRDGNAGKELRLAPGQAVRFTSAGSGSLAVDFAGEGYRAMFARLVPKRRLQWPIVDKTLVAWVSLENLTQQGGGVIAIEQPETHKFDGIAFAELASRKWWAASNNYARSQGDLSDSPEETAGPDRLVQIAIVYKWNRITIFRDGALYANYNTDEKQPFDEGSFVLLGKRCVDRDWLDPPALSPPFVGEIEEARLYDTALTQGVIAALKPNKPSPIAPVGCWTFEDGTARDETDNFPVGELRGNASIVDGKLVLDGRESYLFVPTAKADDRKEASD